jgi:hypothetical protein
MQVSYLYKTKSQVSGNSDEAELSFSPDGLRKPTFFVGELNNKLAFREAISALHNVVISDMRFQPKNRDDYFRWLAQEEQRLLAEFIGTKANIEQELNAVRAELEAMNRQANDVLQPYYSAQRTYFNYLYKENIDAWYVLDPVITVHPDEVFFECFSEDESSYGKLSCRYDVFEHISETAYGTTNIDYSEGLYNEFQKIRHYRQTHLKIDPDGFNIQTAGEESFDEKKIDLPDSWVRGFLQVSSAMTLPMVKLTLQPMDIYNLCYRLRRKKERTGPRSMRFVLEPGKPIKVIFDPWGDEVICARSIYQGDSARTIRVWGRRRLHILERLIPISTKFDVYLLGDGMPSFYVADLGGMTFTLGLSGWSSNDWSKLGNFDLLAPRQEVDSTTLSRVYQALNETWLESSASLAARLQLDESIVKSALAGYSQHGQVLYDIDRDIYRIRELYRQPIPMDKLRFSNEREEKAFNFVKANLAKVTDYRSGDKGAVITGTVMDNAKTYSIELTIDKDLRLVDGQCNCYFYSSNRLRKGPCEHMLALRKAASGQSEGGE